jgi:hypothetical protein
MDTNSTAEPERQAPRQERMFLKIVIGLAIIMTIPFVLFFGLFPLILGRPFESIEEIDVEQIKQLDVRLYNRTDLDNGDDVGPYFASPTEYDRLFKPLLAAVEVEQFNGARGPWLGEYRILLKNGRKGTVRFFWSPAQTESDVALALGSALSCPPVVLAGLKGQIPPPEPQLRFEIGQRKYIAGTTSEFIRVCMKGQQTGEIRRK